MLSKDSNVFSFDYHLNANEQRIIFNQISKSYRGQKNAYYCNISIDQQPPKKLIVLRLNYLIRIYKFSKQMKCKLLHEIHILRIHRIQTIDDYTTEISYENHKISFIFQVCDVFTHKLIRDYRYISTLVKPTAQFAFITHDQNKYPPFKPRLSYTQRIQFFYDSLCTFYSTVYNHQIVHFFHHLILTENVIFDLNMVKYNYLDSDKYKECDLTPAFIILRYIPYFIGITCKSMNFPKGLSFVSSVLRYTSHIRFIILSHCGLLTGAQHLAEAIKSNPRINLVSIDLSGNNRINDLEHLTASFEYIRNPLLSLNLADCGMSQEATIYLVRSLIKNRKLWKLKYLDITGSKMTRECITAFSRHFFIRSRKKTTSNNSSSNGPINSSPVSHTSILSSTMTTSNKENNVKSSGSSYKDKISMSMNLIRQHPASRFGSHNINSNESVQKRSQSDDGYKCCSLVTLKLGIVMSGFSEFTSVLNETNSFLSCLSVAGTKLNEKKAKDLILFLSYTNTLKEIDISRTSLKPSLVAQIVTSIIGNNEITTFSIHMNSLNLNKINLLKVIKAFESEPLSRLRIWTSLSLEDNGMNSDDLRQLLPVLSQMVNLKELNIGMNFDQNSSNIETLLPNFLTFQSLSRLSLRGTKFHSLGYNKLQNLFISIADRQNVPISLDIRNNEIGDDGIRDIAELAKNDKFFELQIDGSSPETSHELRNLLLNLSKSKALAIVNFPVKDAEKFSQKGANEIAEAGVKMSIQFEKNIANYGIHSRWTFSEIPEVEQIVNEMTYLKHCENGASRLYEHSLAIETVGLPLPFQESLEDLNQSEFKLLPEDEEFKIIDEIYFSPSAVFVEQNDKKISSIHYNALKMKIPGIDSVSATTDFETTSNSHSNYQNLFNEKISMSSEERKLTHLFDDESLKDESESASNNEAASADGKSNDEKNGNHDNDNDNDSNSISIEDLN